MFLGAGFVVASFVLTDGLIKTFDTIVADANLVVHAAMGLLPLAAIDTVIVAAIPRARRQYAPVASAVELVATIAVGLAQQSGESLEERVNETELVEEHTNGVRPRCRGRSPLR